MSVRITYRIECDVLDPLCLNEIVLSEPAVIGTYMARASAKNNHGWLSCISKDGKRLDFCPVHQKVWEKVVAGKDSIRLEEILEMGGVDK